MANFDSKALMCMCINLILIASSPFNAVSAGSCREAQLCCNGRDSSCVVQKAPINAIVEDLTDKPCYCDHACLKLGDCCADFKSHCGVLDCEVSEWGQWSECDKNCGIGMMLRTRDILQPAQNGGKHCPSLVQKRGCQGLRCHGHHDKKVLREVALLLPAELNSKTHNYSDTRRNSQFRYRTSVIHNREDEYCVEYEVLKASKPCHKLTPYNKLLEGDRIAVRCGAGAFIEDSPSAIQNIEVDKNLLLQQNNTSRKPEITNNSIGGSEDEEDEEDFDDDSEEYDHSMLPTITSTTPTTTTTQIPLATYHCRGEGLSGRTTRWSALAAPSCRGKWLRLTVGTPKKCSKPQFVFV